MGLLSHLLGWGMEKVQLATELVQLAMELLVQLAMELVQLAKEPVLGSSLLRVTRSNLWAHESLPSWDLGTGEVKMMHYLRGGQVPVLGREWEFLLLGCLGYSQGGNATEPSSGPRRRISWSQLAEAFVSGYRHCLVRHPLSW